MDSDERIPESEIDFRTSRSGGPGGQHVNRRETRVEASWNVRESPSVTDEERERILERLGSRIGKDGVLRVVAAEERSQHKNRQIALRRLRELVAKALTVRKPRKKTKPSRAAKRRRLQEKRERKDKKRLRKPPEPE